jgi:hypothetical protein
MCVQSFNHAKCLICKLREEDDDGLDYVVGP